jgi:hypothetical protein
MRQYNDIFTTIMDTLTLHRNTMISGFYGSYLRLHGCLEVCLFMHNAIPKKGLLV